MILGHPHMDLACFRYNCSSVWQSSSVEVKAKRKVTRAGKRLVRVWPYLVRGGLALLTAKWYLDANRQVTALLPCSTPCLLYPAVSSTPRPSLTQLLQPFPSLTIRSQLKP